MTSLIKWTSPHSRPAAGECVIDPSVVKAQTHARARHPRTPGEHARSIVEQAEQQAGDIIRGAEQQAEAIRSEAFNQGLTAAQASIEDERQALGESLRRMELEFAEELDGFWTQIEPQVVGLAVQIASKIVRHEVEADSEFVMQTVKSALWQLRDRQDLRISVSPADHAIVRQRKEDIMAACDGIRSIEVVEDRRVGQGGCLVESGNGTLDVRLESQLTEVEKLLMEEAENDGRQMPPEA
jgi:flagellar assembly protein FliH